MTTRDRSVLTVVGFVIVVVAFWFLVLSPKHKQAGDVSAELTAAQQRLTTAQASAAGGALARASYDADYATVARLGKAVPVDDDVPSLVYQLEHTAHDTKVDFRTIKLNTSAGAAAAAPTGAAANVAAANGSSASSTTPPVTSVLPPGATVGTAGFPVMPFSFDFDGKFFAMQRFLHALDGLTTVNGKSISVKGRLLTVDGVSLDAGPKGFPDVSATVAVTAYLLPADEGLTAGAAAVVPSTGAGTTAASASTTSPAAGSTPTASLIGNN